MRITLRLILLPLLIVCISPARARYYLTGGIAKAVSAGLSGSRCYAFYVQIHETHTLADGTTIDRIAGSFYGRTSQCAAVAASNPQRHCPGEPLIVQKDLLTTDTSSQICAADWLSVDTNFALYEAERAVFLSGRKAHCTEDTATAPLRICPNTGPGILCIEIHLPQRLTNIRLSIADNAGTELRSLDLAGDFRSFHLTLDVGDLPAGQYLVRVAEQNNILAAGQALLQ